MARVTRFVSASLVVAALSLALACGHEPAVCGENLSIDISNGVLDVYNGVLIGQTGSGGGSFSCNHGGGGTYTGSWSGAGYDLTITFASCVIVGAESTLTLSGAIHDQTNLGSHVESGHADALMMQGNETACNQDPIDNTCAVEFDFTGRDSSGVPTGSGSVCGITFP